MTKRTALTMAIWGVGALPDAIRDAVLVDKRESNDEFEDAMTEVVDAESGLGCYEWYRSILRVLLSELVDPTRHVAKVV